MLFLGKSSPVFYSPSFPSVQWNVMQFLRYELYTLVCLEKASDHWATKSSWRLCFLIADSLQKLLGDSYVISPYCYLRGIIQSDKACLLMRYHKALLFHCQIDWSGRPIQVSWIWMILKSGREYCALVCVVIWQPLDSRGWMRMSVKININKQICLSSSFLQSLDIWF